jgi:hypothetical protein
MTDTTTTMTGAEFQRHVGTDPERWAEAFLAEFARAGGLRTEAGRQGFVSAWFRDAMEAAVNEAVRHETAAICPPTS